MKQEKIRSVPHPLYRGTWFPTIHWYWCANGYKVSIRYIAVLGFQPREAGAHEKWASSVSIHYIAVLGFQLTDNITDTNSEFMFQSAISRYLVSNPTSKTSTLTSGGGNGLHTPRRIDHIPTFASLNSDKNTRSNHYTPNAGIELSETTPPPLRVNPVQNWI